ncbi:unnamed protein product [Caenorhabditis angaria]|uniref:Uncharacterized protein n=1 Tax=Caenorhabditis angaria TaxID=860376 RepID=A0A9P1IXA2_9PELO|nr:unnamed protein product [Caenorhabditis angaria]
MDSDNQAKSPQWKKIKFYNDPMDVEDLHNRMEFFSIALENFESNTSSEFYSDKIKIFNLDIIFFPIADSDVIEQNHPLWNIFLANIIDLWNESSLRRSVEDNEIAKLWWFQNYFHNRDWLINGEVPSLLLFRETNQDDGFQNL